MCVVQIRVRVTDGGGLTGETLVTLTVSRNLNSPVFNPDQYSETVQDNEPLSSSIVQVKAVDADVQVSVLSLLSLTDPVSSVFLMTTENYISLF